MATFTFGTLSTAFIEVRTGIGTVDQLFTDINNSAIMSRSGSGIFGDPYIYTVVGNNCELELETGVKLTLSEYGEIEWTTTTNNLVQFDIQSGSVFNAEQNTRISGDTADGGNHPYIYIYGQMNCFGTSGNVVTIERWRWARFLCIIGNPSSHWSFVDFKLYTATDQYAIYIDYNNQVKNHTFTDIVLTGSDFGYGLALYDSDFSQMTFSRLTIDNTRYGISFGRCVVKLQDSTIKNTWSNPSIGVALGGQGYYSKKTNESGFFLRAMEQPKITFDTCSFIDNDQDGATEYQYLYSYQQTVKFKNCNFEGNSVGDPSTYGVASNYDSKILYEGTTTFTHVTTNRLWATNGTHYHCYALNLTVYDENNEFMSNAYVIVRQKEGREEWHFMTRESTDNPSGSTGQIRDLHGDPPVFVEKEETSTGVFDQWSDGIGDHFHIITVSKEGYKTWVREVAFTAEQTIDVTLVPEAGPLLLPIEYK